MQSTNEAKLRCLRCTSERLATAAKIQPADGLDINVMTLARPEAFLFRNARRDKVHARICGDCGHVEWFVDDPKGLYAHWLEGVK